MLATMFKVFEVTEIQLTPAAITRLRVSAILSVFVFPIIGAIEFLNLPDGARGVFIAAGLICTLAMAYCFFSRLANRLWIPEKYLDESEIERKRRSGGLTYQIILAFIMVLLGALTFWTEGIKTMSLDPRLIVFVLASVAFISMSLQTIIAAYMMSPVSEGEVKIVAADKRYVWFTLASVFVIGALAFATHSVT